MTHFRIAAILTLCLFSWFGLTFYLGLQQNKIYLKNTTAFSLAVSAFDQKNYEQAIELALHLQQQDKKSYEVHYILGKSFFFNEKYELAKVHFDKAFELYPYFVENEEAMILLGVTNMKMDELDNVLTIYQALGEIHISPTHFFSYLELTNYIKDKGNSI